MEKEDDEGEHGHEDHVAHKEEGHDHAEYAEDGHKDEDHAAHEDDHADEAGHTEFHAKYLLDCADPAQAKLITFAYFDTFPNALELEIQVISDQGAKAFEVVRRAPTLDLRSLL